MHKSTTHIFQLLLGLGLCAFSTIPACASGDAGFEKALSATEFILKDGTHAKIACITPMGDGRGAEVAKDLLQSLGQNGEWQTGQLSSEADRWGVFIANPQLGHKYVGEILVEHGLAFAMPPCDDEGYYNTLVAAEKITPYKANAAGPLIGSYAIIEGTVVDAARIKNKIYLNFGEDWRTDFTVKTSAQNARIIKKAGLDLLTLKGKKLCVRGWVRQELGPMVDLTSRQQIIVSAD